MLDSQNNATLVVENALFPFKQNVQTRAHVTGLSLYAWLFPLRLHFPLVDSKDRSQAIEISVEPRVFRLFVSGWSPGESLR